MLGWIPERIYKKIKNDTEYADLVNIIKNVDNSDLVLRLVSEEKLRIEKSDEVMSKENSIIDRLCTEEEKREHKYTYCVDGEYLINALKTETDIENILYIYELMAGCIHRPTRPEGLIYVEKFVDLYEQHKDMTFSEKIYEEYFTFKCQLHLTEYFLNSNVKYGEFKEYKTWMDNLAEEIYIKFNHSEYIVKLISSCITRQFFYFMANMIETQGVRYDFGYMIENEILPELDTVKYEYSNFSYYKIQVFDMICKFFFDRRDKRFFKYLKEMTDMINWSFSNKEATCKALNFYNSILIMHYLTIITKYRIMTEKHMPWLKDEYKVDLSLLSDYEKKYTEDYMSAADIIKQDYNIDLMNPMTKELCDREMSYIKSYIELNTDNFHVFEYLQ